MIKISLLALALVATATTLVGARTLTASSQNDRADFDSKQTDRSVGTSGAQRIKVRIPLGEVSLRSTSGSEVTVHIVRSAKRPLSEIGKKWLTESKVVAERRGEDVLVEDLPFGQHDKVNSRGSDQVDVKYEIGIPSSLAVDLDLTAGKASATGHFRALKCTVLAGELTLSGVACDGNMSLTNKAGEISADLKSVPGRDSSISVGAGEAILKLPQHADAVVTAKVGVGEISGLPSTRAKKGDMQLSDKRSGKFGRGGSRFSIDVGIGSIAVHGGGEAVATLEKAIDSDREADEMDSSLDEADKELKGLDLKAFNMQGLDLKAPKGLKGLEQLKALGEKQDLDDLKELQNLDIDKVVQSALKEAMVEVDKALKDADREMREAMNEVKAHDVQIDDKEINAAVRKAVAAAMKSAHESIELAMKAMRAASRSKGGS